MIPDRATACLALGQVLVWAGLYYVFPALLVRWTAEPTWSSAVLTGAITTAIVFSAVASPLAGRLIDSGRGAELMSGSALIGGLLLIILSHVTTLIGFYLVWALIGVMMAGCLYEPCFAIVTRTRQSTARSTIVTITLIAGFASTLSFTGAHALSEWFGWRMTVQVFAAVIIVLASPLLWFGVRGLETGFRASSPARVTHTISVRQILKRGVFWLLALAFAAIAVVHGMTLQHLLLLLNERGVSPTVAVSVASLIGPMQVVGRAWMTTVGAAWSNHAVAVGCFVIISGSMLLLMLAGTSPLLLYAFVMLFGAGYGLVSVIRPVIARDLLGSTGFGAKSGLLAMLYLAGSALAPLLGSSLHSRSGYTAMLIVSIGLCLVGLALYGVARTRAASPDGPPPMESIP